MTLIATFGGWPCCIFHSLIFHHLFTVDQLFCIVFRDMAASIEIMQLDFEMENFTSQSVTRRINWNIDYRGQAPVSDAEKVVTELTVVQKDIQAIIPLSMVRNIQ